MLSLILGFTFLLWVHLGIHAQTNKSIPLPFLQNPPVNASQTLDPRLASFSIEFAYLNVFGGNKTHPNLLTKELMQRLVERTGVGPVSSMLSCCCICEFFAYRHSPGYNLFCRISDLVGLPCEHASLVCIQGRLE